MPHHHRFKFDKLVRNKMPEILRQLGIQVCERRMNEEEYIQRLKDKLGEEVEEIQVTCASPEELREELADLLEVIMALAQVHALTFDDILEEGKRKREEKGGFDQRVYVDVIDISEKNPSLDYYKAQPNKYPEVN